jgi:uncharacterized membrane protein/protein-disulfide isomerase
MTKTAGWTALASALAGLAASVAAAYVHYRLLRDPTYLSFCDISATMSCTQVYSSHYGSMFGMPVAIFGAIWFALALLLSSAGLWGPSSVRESVPGYLFAGSTLALSMILYLGYASFVLLKMVCVLCLITYAAVITLFLVSGAAGSVPMTSLPRRAVQDLKALVSSPLALALAVLFIGGAASTLAFFPTTGNPGDSLASDAGSGGSAAAADQDQRSEFERWYAGQPRMNLVVPTEGAKVLVIKFNDYQCPPCRQSFMDYKSIWSKWEKSNPGEVKLVLKDFPLDSECNNNVQQTLHPSGCEAAVAARLSRERNRITQFEDWVFTNQPTLTPEAVARAAKDVGDVPNFEARYQAVLDQVKADIAYGRTLGVRSTPTFFINGVKIEGALPAVYFDQAIAYELARANGK